ncbi:transcriptional repressor [Ruficoccus amylovorans]|uniref:Transcriptional repressor n=1 Tax=Ruficoccus amylovorans TaxID=1804625 RepID=A0A842HAA3_9BACT|nr:Fur family transcriptional regulator [Ruficoccus amylovorans]MBC2593342.1 transcriptional repressor [Ruficoccus amylovorans]
MTHAHEKPRIDDAIDVLRREHYRITEPRKAMLAVLVEQSRPLSAEQLHQLVGSDKADLVTIYRSLEAFEKAGIVQRFNLEAGGKALYELVAENHHHHHIICRKCHRAEKLDFCEAEKLEALAKNLGYENVSHVLELYGVCEDCRSH